MTASRGIGKGNYVHRRKSLAERFWSKVDKTPGYGPWGDCWVWTAQKSSLGYGRISGPGHDGRPLVASRVAWELEHGPLPAEEKVLHRCDYPPCVRIHHLFKGTVADNNADMVNKDRNRFGERHHNHQLTEDEVRWLRANSVPGRSKRAMASELRITTGHVYKVLSREAWRRLE